MNNSKIAAANPGSTLWDDKVKGLHLRVFPTRKVFYLVYRPKNAPGQRRPRLGDFGTLTLAQARNAARAILVQVAAGGDPVQEARTRRLSLTFAELADRYLVFIRTDPKNRKKSAKGDEYALKRHLLPRWGRRAAVDIVREDIEEMHNALANTPYQANRLLALASRMFILAESWRVRPEHSNPCRLVERYPERKRRRFMTGAEAPVVAALLVHYEPMFPEAVLFIYLLILTGARPDEIARAEWSMLDGNKLILTEHKTDEHTDERVIFLPPRVMTLLAQVRRRSGSIVGIKSPRYLWRKIRSEAGCPDLRLYDLRRTFASAALRAGYTLDQIGELLGHTSGTTAKRYAWLMTETATEATNKTAELIEGMMSPRALIASQTKP